jgi:hypothetical protein
MTLGARPGQVRLRYVTRPKSETMRVTRQLGLPPGFRLSNRPVWHSTAFKFQITNYAMKPVIRKACPRAGRCNFGAHARAAFAS